MSNYFEWIKAAHIIAMTCWMAGMFYLPRLYVYHCQAKIGSDQDKTFQVMELKLLRIIINPSMVLTIVFGLMLASVYGFKALGMWFHLKMLAVVLLTVLHGFLARWRKDFAKGENRHSERFYRIINEVPVVLFVMAVILVVVKPFEF